MYIISLRITLRCKDNGKMVSLVTLDVKNDFDTK